MRRLLVLLLAVVPLLSCQYADRAWVIRAVVTVTDSHGNPVAGQRLFIHTEVIDRDGDLVAGTELDDDRTTNGQGEATLAYTTDFRYDRSTGVYTTGVRARAWFIYGGRTNADDTEYFPADTVADYDVIVPLSIQLQ
jgi:hypothetical protein